MASDKTGEQSDRMLRAAESGAAQKQRAHEALLNTNAQIQAEAGAAGQRAANMYAQGEELKQRDRSLNLQEDQLDLEAAKSGFQRGGNPELERRQSAMRQGMDQGSQFVGPPTEDQARRAEQAGKGVEYSGGKWVPTEQGRQEQTRKAFEADTDRMRAEAYRQQTAQSLRAAQMSGDKEAQKNLKANLMKPMESDAKMLSNLISGKANDRDWSSIESMMKDNPDPELQKEIQSKFMGPRVRDAMNQKIASSALKFIDTTGGDLPDSDVVDYTNPFMVQFTNQVKEVGTLIGQLSQQSNGDFARLLNLETLNDKIRFQNQLAARAVMAGLTSFSPDQGNNPFMQMAPSAGQPQPPAAPGGESSLVPADDQGFQPPMGPQKSPHTWQNIPSSRLK